eukprot:scaffold10050_cov143-Isochrysis_galbana.AAC.2
MYDRAAISEGANPTSVHARRSVSMGEHSRLLSGQSTPDALKSSVHMLVNRTQLSIRLSRCRLET